MKTQAVTLVAVLLMTTTACTTENDDRSGPTPAPPATPSTPAASVTPPSSETSSEPSTEPSEPSDPAPTDPSDIDVDGDGFGADDGVVGLTTSSQGTSCFDTGVADYGWFDTEWRSHADLEAATFRLDGATGVTVVGSPVTVPPVNFGGRIDYSGLIKWADKSPLVEERLISWRERQDTDFLSPIEGQTGLLLFHLRFAAETVAGKKLASLDSLVVDYTTRDGETGSVTLELDQRFGFDPSVCN